MSAETGVLIIAYNLVSTPFPSASKWRRGKTSSTTTEMQQKLQTQPIKQKTTIEGERRDGFT